MTEILMVTAGFPPMVGGIATDAYQFAKNAGRKMAVLAPNCRGTKKFDEKQSFKTFRMKLIDMHLFYKPGKDFLLFSAFQLVVMLFYVMRYAVKLRPKRLYLTHWTYVIPALPASKLLEIPYYFAAHGTEVVQPMKSRFHKALLNISVENATKIICLGSYQKHNLIKGGFPSSKLFVVNVGVDLDAYSPDIDPSEVIEKYGLKNKKVILTVGRLVKRKGHDMVIKSLPSVLKNIPNALYMIVGEGPELENLKSLVKELDLEENVMFVGYVSGKFLPKCYNACDVFIMASREVNGDIEGFGIVYLEANACGKPVIAGRSGGTRSAVQHGVNGLLVDPLSIEDIAEKMALLLTDKKLTENMGRRGRMLAEKKFNYSFVAKKILNVIENT